MARRCLSSPFRSLYCNRARVFYERRPFFVLYKLASMGVNSSLCAGICMLLLRIKGTPFPPWSKVKFPNIFFEIYTVSTQTATRMLPNGMRINVPLFGYGARITNLESEQNASLTIDLFLKLTPNSQVGIGEASGTVPDWPLDPNLSLNMIQMPIVLTPGTTIGGDLVYDVSMITAFGQPADPPKIRFRIQDHISHQAKDVIMEASFGRFSRDDMIDSRGGVEIVEAQEDVESSGTTNASGPNPPEQSSPPLADGPQPSDPQTVSRVLATCPFPC
jgi:hypothetical protein